MSLQHASVSKLKRMAPAIFFCLFVLFIYFPGVIYFGNANEFQYSFFDLLVTSAVLALCSFLILALLSFVIPSSLMPNFTSCIYGCGILLWVQGTFFVRDFGLLDGRAMDFSKYFLFNFVDIGVWAFCLSSVFYFFNKLENKLSFVGRVVLVFCVISLFVSGVHSKKTRETGVTAQGSVPPGIYKYSKNFNIVQIFMDHFQTDVFLELVEEENYRNVLKGFTVFKENTASPATRSSIPALFSGRIYDGSEYMEEYYVRSMTDRNFLTKLFSEGYATNIVPSFDFPSQKITNVYVVPLSPDYSDFDNKFFEAIHLLEVSLFRSLPQPLKQVVYNRGNWLLTKIFSKSPAARAVSDINFLKQYTERITPELTQPAYHFVSLYTPHPPYVFKKDGTFAGVLEATRENYKIQAKYTLKAAVGFLEKLKQLNLYDSSLIVLLSDHGAEFPPVINGKSIDLGIVRAPALLAIKPVGHVADMSISNAPTSIIDIPATIMDSLGLEWGHGEPVFSLNDKSKRTRFFVGTEAGYQITGSIYDRKSWEKIEVKKTNIRREPYELGSIIQFGLLGNAAPYKRKGWGGPGFGFEWTNGNEVSLELPLLPCDSDLLVTIKAFPFLFPKRLTEQKVILRIGNTILSEWMLTEDRHYDLSAVIPKELIQDRLTLTFEFPNATRPRDLGISPDKRLAALGFIQVALYKFSYSYGHPIMFDKAGESEKFILNGWSKKEPHHRWTEGAQARLLFRLETQPHSDLLLRLNAAPYLGGGLPRQKIGVLANGLQIAIWEMKKSDWYQATIPYKLIDKDGRLEISFIVSNPTAPCDVGEGPDKRKVGFAAKELVITEQGRKP